MGDPPTWGVYEIHLPTCESPCCVTLQVLFPVLTLRLVGFDGHPHEYSIFRDIWWRNLPFPPIVNVLNPKIFCSFQYVVILCHLYVDIFGGLPLANIHLVLPFG